jgi:acyl-CoA-binding protein
MDKSDAENKYIELVASLKDKYACKLKSLKEK